MSKYYKVLNGNKACSGGSFKYSLPALVNGEWQAGEWHEHTGELVLCESGFHVTQKPFTWVSSKGCDVYECEIAGNCTDYDSYSEKLACSKIRLLRKLSEAELLEHKIIINGKHTVTSGEYKVFGNAKVIAYGNSTVIAYGNSTVIAYGNSTVNAYSNSAKVSLNNQAVGINRLTGKVFNKNGEI